VHVREVLEICLHSDSVVHNPRPSWRTPKPRALLTDG
jgi:hypothetical protein